LKLPRYIFFFSDVDVNTINFRNSENRTSLDVVLRLRLRAVDGQRYNSALQCIYTAPLWDRSAHSRSPSTWEVDSLIGAMLSQSFNCRRMIGKLTSMESAARKE